MDRKGQMIKKIFILILLAIILCAAPSWATIFNVTQAEGVCSGWDDVVSDFIPIKNYLDGKVDL